MAGDTTRISTRFRNAPTRYLPKKRLALGGMAEVWSGEAIFENGESHEVALKRVLPHLASDELYRSMFQDEARLGMLLHHRNIVRVYDARSIGETFIMVMELVEGTSLKGLLERAHARGACMPVATALHITRELARALAYAHVATDTEARPLGIVHRDVSPHNLLLSRAGGVKLADFGLADASVHSTQLGGGMLGGKLGYLAPELIDQKPTTPQIDVFAAGIVLWEMLCGRRLFVGEDDRATVRAVAKCDVPPPSSINRKVPRDVDRLVASVLARDPDVRTQGAARLAADLDAMIARLDPGVSQRDVALLVGLHVAMEQMAAAPKQDLFEDASGFARELEAFVQAGGQHDLGAAPLDPSLFDGGNARRRGW